MYGIFIEDYIKAAFEESGTNQIYEADAVGKEGVYKINYYFRDHLQIPHLSEQLAKKKNQDLIIEYTGRFMDEHSEQLSTPGPIYVFTFNEKDVKFLYDMFDIDSEQLISLYNEMIKETFYGKIYKVITGYIMNAPYKLLLVSIMIEAIQKGYDDIITCCEYLYGFSEYAVVYREFWKVGVREDVMKNTIEHLGEKYKIKKLKTLQELLKYDVTKAVELHNSDLTAGYDHVYTNMIYSIRTKIRNKFRNIADQYYKNIEANASMHTTDPTFDDGTIVDSAGHATNIGQIVDNTINKFTVNSVNTSIAKVCAEANKVDRDILLGYINQIFSAKNNRLPKFIENVITVYLNRNPTEDTISSSEFVNYGLALYRSIANSKDSLCIELKSILDYWMNTIINIRQFYQRDATVIAYTRGIWNYIIIMIRYYN
jgi:hypothetical protein